MPPPRTRQDLLGPGPEPFDVPSPAVGRPELPAAVSDGVRPTGVGADVDGRGIEHSTWPVTVHAFPDASIPVARPGAVADRTADQHLELGAQLARR